jgi:hypothetical protein
VTNSGGKMSGHVRGVCERGANLVEAQGVLGGHGFGRFTSGEGPNDGGDVNASAAQARLPEAHVGVHRNARKHFHGLDSNPDVKKWGTSFAKPRVVNAGTTPRGPIQITDTDAGRGEAFAQKSLGARRSDCTKSAAQARDRAWGRHPPRCERAAATPASPHAAPGIGKPEQHFSGVRSGFSERPGLIDRRTSDNNRL